MLLAFRLLARWRAQQQRRRLVNLLKKKKNLLSLNVSLSHFSNIPSLSLSLSLSLFKLKGSCGFGMLDKGAWPYWSVAALSTENSFFKAGPLNGCGQCFEVRCVDLDGPWKGRCITGPNQVSVIVQITDSCPECGADHLDMQALTFHKLAPMEVGRVNIEYRRVECVPPKKVRRRRRRERESFCFGFVIFSFLFSGSFFAFASSLVSFALRQREREKEKNRIRAPTFPLFFLAAEKKTNKKKLTIIE